MRTRVKGHKRAGISVKAYLRDAAASMHDPDMPGLPGLRRLGAAYREDPGQEAREARASLHDQQMASARAWVAANELKNPDREPWTWGGGGVAQGAHERAEAVADEDRLSAGERRQVEVRRLLARARAA